MHVFLVHKVDVQCIGKSNIEHYVSYITHLDRKVSLSNLTGLGSPNMWKTFY